MFAESEFSGVRSHKHGGTEADHAKALRAMGVDIPESKAEMPMQLRYLYDIYMELRFSRVPNDNGFSLVAREPLTTHDIDFYSRTSGLDFDRWEINSILSLDSIFERSVN